MDSHVFGLNHDVRNNISYLDELSVVYPAGFQIVHYSLEQKTQKFIPVHVDGESMSTMAVSPTGAFVAVGIKIISTPKNPQDPEKNANVLLYDLQTARRKKVFATGEAPSTKDFVSIAFTSDNKYIVAQGAAPEWCLYMWSVEKGKMVAWARAIPNANSDVNQMTCNHHDSSNSQICVTGNNLFRVFRFVEGIFKMAYQSKTDKNILCHAWVSENRVVAGTQDAKILIYEAGELILEISYVVPQANNPVSTPAINTISIFSSGLLIGLNTGVGVLFDKTDDSYHYKKSKEFLLEETEISSVALSPHEDSAVVTLKNSQIYMVTFDADTKQGEEVKCDRLSQSFHSGTILSMDTSTSKPLLVTSGTDKSVRVWNYMDNSIEVVKYFDDPAQWRVYFAAIWSSSVVIYDTWSFDVLGHIKSGAGKIKSIAWSNDDNRFMTCTLDGAIDHWNVATLKKESGVPAGGVLINSVAMNLTSKITYAATNDGNIRHIGKWLWTDCDLQEIVNGNTTREFSAKTTLSH
eukprot:jgi/Hompol1/4591/HPOL_003747-RA